MFNYGGSLTNNGASFDLDNVPVEFASHMLLSFAVNGQVNMIVAGADNVVQFWDGDTVMTHGNGVIEGGFGIWNNVDAYFTDPSGEEIQTWQNGTAIFAGNYGNIQLGDDIHVQGMQFMTGNYLVEQGLMRITVLYSILLIMKLRLSSQTVE